MREGQMAFMIKGGAWIQPQELDGPILLAIYEHLEESYRAGPMSWDKGLKRKL